MERVRPSGNVWAISDLHVSHKENSELVLRLRPEHEDDWLIIAGDVGETVEHLEWTLDELGRYFSTLVWVPGNHELWTTRDDTDRSRGDLRYRRLVEVCRRRGVLTPEDPFPVWEGSREPVVVAPLFLLYDYTFLPKGANTPEQGLAAARASGVVCTDEYLLHPEPYASRADWCAARLAETKPRLAELGGARTVLVNHWPLVRQSTRVLRHPEFAQWCGTEATAEWHREFRAEAVVYGHLHLPRTTVYDGVRFEEVSVGYPHEWQRQTFRPQGWMRRILTPG
ncbi:metallophosphoesterase family protein [Streptomyces sp. NY05-11A]|uniref:metallophosphoesterase family protein n=1 Tax=Streptomyces soliscabiei TaxID=588897 RepID=UPI0029A88151|nr:metallophosphoesterase [Streptomyces sp. NY05-11A]MDX2680499.1 metallophosphoesterase [Streptomyces sp. NY05-11A]